MYNISFKFYIGQGLRQDLAKSFVELKQFSSQN